ncbi:hypothetical protein BAUCODRAFT_67495 [Baudoinia panamericana UAMH 10762]|uniref:UBX domain-containing protein n=1 Tax=Baudoinia panamericana (strain UAMH 10762) TaxID=717646 RepID=M2NHB3_BAUPA|nr:uncharacterized protein BAUCODRAFT_67495 [Baudoinia panamericana UAMH 10762]EMC98415.1 hypothetical protein BAUCODRAFT_67495 [Baudoinia panamericana UAMH 10762]
MFHAGDLNSGISAAISEQKLVACFIAAPPDSSANNSANTSADSTLWEEEWLPDLQEIIADKAVLLRMERGSKEAGFLNAFCSIDRAPTLIVVHNGRVLEKLEGGVSRDDFVERLLRALGVEGMDESATAEDATVEEATASGPVHPDAAPLQPTQSTPAQASSTPQQLFPDRAARLEADRLAREAAEKEARNARTEARRNEAEEAHAAHQDKGKQRATTENSEKQRARDAWIYEQKQRKDEAKKERERILNQIESDRQERKAKAARAKQAETQQEGASSPLPDARMAETKRSAGAGGMCSLQLRLFDGTSVRGRFSAPTATLAKDVRNFVKEQAPPGSGGADIPYSFRQILAPNPSRSIEVSEEHQTLSELDLVPNATLVLVPVAGAVASAYNPADAGYLGWASSWLNYGYSSLPNVSYYLPSFSRLYMGGTADPSERSNVEGAAMAGADTLPAAADAGEGSAAKVRVKTLADQREEQRKREGTEFYNGNSLGFEPRKGDED